MVRQKDHFISHKMILSGSRLTVNYSDSYSDELFWRDCNDISNIISDYPGYKFCVKTFNWKIHMLYFSSQKSEFLCLIEIQIEPKIYERISIARKILIFRPGTIETYHSTQK
jgi:hypothetical protein